MTAYGEVVLKARGISKAFPCVNALDGVDLALRAGHSTALLGENSAGKFTLMKIEAGVQSPDSGDLIAEGPSFSAKDARSRNVIARMPRKKRPCVQRFWGVAVPA